MNNERKTYLAQNIENVASSNGVHLNFNCYAMDIAKEK